MKAQICGLAILALIGCAYAQTFASIQDAVAVLPELSMLNKNTNSIKLADQLRDPNFVGTLFAPTDSGLKPLEDAVGGDLTSLLGDPDQVNDVFSTSVIPGKALTLADLSDGQKLTTLNGNEVTVKIVQTAAGKIYYINKARITDGNIKAGKAIIHEMSSIVVPQEYQDMLDALVPADASTATPTVDKSAASVATPAGGDTSATDGATPISTTHPATTTKPSTTAPPSSPTTAGTVPTDEPASRVLSTSTSSAGSAAMGAALLAVPALLAMLL